MKILGQIKTNNVSKEKLRALRKRIEGEFYFDDKIRKIYATDASSYRELPLAVSYPKNEEDIKQLILFAKENKTSIIPRTAGTSLAGQVVGNGIVVDVSKYFNRILEFNTNEMWVKVQPGVVRDELNKFLEPLGFMFGPETSTSNRAMMGGMIGNNSCGSNSVKFGSTRDHLLEVEAFLSDGSKVLIGDMPDDEFKQKISNNSTLEEQVYNQIYNALNPSEVREEIIEQFPKKSIPRRNTGYAIDLLLDSSPFQGKEDFNFCKLLAGSEGTLAFTLTAKLKILPLPPANVGLLCVHFNNLYDSLEATQIALKYDPYAVELMDHFILECTKENIEQSKNRFFVEGDPAAILVIEIRKDDPESLNQEVEKLIADFKKKKFGYHFPLVTGPDTKRVWTLRKAGLGLLSNIPGDAKAVPVIEDTAVEVADLPAFIREFNESLKKHDLECVHYAHAGSGELHLRPIINLKTEEGNSLFRTVAEEISELVKKYKGSLSGEHGDGRLRGEFIPYMIGERNYEILKQIKKTWDPDNIFNPGKIVDTPSMNTSLRFMPGHQTEEMDTILDFSDYDGIIRAAEQCNGSGDCRKSELIGGTMCPSFMATRDEKDTTRARANILREITTENSVENVFDSKEIHEIMDLCLSCKGCKSECPSNVDMARIKAEFLNQYYKTNKVPFRSRIIGNVNKLNSLASITPGLYNWMMSGTTGKIIKKSVGFAGERSMPSLASSTLKSWWRKNKKEVQERGNLNKGSLYLFIDEFTNYFDFEVGKKAILFLTKVGYEVKVVKHEESGRAFLSKGILEPARKLATKNVEIFKDLVSSDTPLVGIEPSAILSFRDEYPLLLRSALQKEAQKISKNTFLFEEFVSSKLDKGELGPELFKEVEKDIKVHGHCHQKAISSLTPIKKILSLPPNYSVSMISSGCCGMAGSFGYEKEHYDLSLKVGELVLFPTVREQEEDTIIAASGTSCRHQLLDGTGRKALHSAEILYDALK